MRALSLFAVLLVASGCASAPPRPEVIAYQAPLEWTHQLPALSGPAATAPSGQFTCDGTIRRIPAANGGYLGIWVWAGTNSGGASATPIFVGDSAVTTSGMPLCTGNCPRVDQAYETRDLYCVTAGSSVTVTYQLAKP